jgi:hypothetical protein
MRRGLISTPGDVIDKFNKVIGTNERCLYQKIEACYLIEKQRIPTAKTRCNKIGNLFLFNFRQSTQLNFRLEDSSWAVLFFVHRHN